MAIITKSRTVCNFRFYLTTAGVLYQFVHRRHERPDQIVFAIRIPVSADNLNAPEHAEESRWSFKAKRQITTEPVIHVVRSSLEISVELELYLKSSVA